MGVCELASACKYLCWCHVWGSTCAWDSSASVHVGKHERTHMHMCPEESGGSLWVQGSLKHVSAHSECAWDSMQLASMIVFEGQKLLSWDTSINQSNKMPNWSPCFPSCNPFSTLQPVWAFKIANQITSLLGWKPSEGYWNKSKLLIIAWQIRPPSQSDLCGLISCHSAGRHLLPQSHRQEPLFLSFPPLAPLAAGRSPGSRFQPDIIHGAFSDHLPPGPLCAITPTSFLSSAKSAGSERGAETEWGVHRVLWGAAPRKE